MNRQYDRQNSGKSDEENRREATNKHHKQMIKQTNKQKRAEI